MKKILLLTLAMTLVLGWSAIAGAAAPQDEFEIDYWNVSVDGSDLQVGYVCSDEEYSKAEFVTQSSGPDSYGSRGLNMDLDKTDSFRVEARYKNLLFGYTSVATDGDLEWESNYDEYLYSPYDDDDYWGLSASTNFDFNAVDLGTYWEVVKNPKYNVVFEGMLRIGKLEQDSSLIYKHCPHVADQITTEVSQPFLGPVVGVRTNYQIGKANFYGVLRYGVMFTETDGKFTENEVCLESGNTWDEYTFDYSEDESFTVQELGVGVTYPLSPVLTAKAGWFSTCYSGVLKSPQPSGWYGINWTESDLVMSGYQLGLVFKF